MRMLQVDAFADRVFAGNPAAVIVLNDWLPDKTMLAVAQENNLAETAFTRARIDGTWDLRWFTPTHEVDFCGHATLATAHVLTTEHGYRDPQTFHTRVGKLCVTVVEEGYQLDIPALPPEPLQKLPTELDGMFDAEPKRLFRNFENLFADLGDEEAVRSFEPDLMRIAKLGPIGLAITGQGANENDADFVSRYFAPGSGIPEDPVTGSTHATLVPYWAKRLDRKELSAFQASPRGGKLKCELSGDRVLLRGNAVTFMDAHIFLPT